MKLGDKPLEEMTHEEMVEAITTLREAREALRSDAIKRKRDAGLGAPPQAVKTPRASKIKATDPYLDNMLAFLKGEKDAL